MKLSIIILIFTLNVFLFSPITKQKKTTEKDNNNNITSQNILDYQQPESEDSDDPLDDEEYLFYDQEIFTRKLFQKDLQPLSKKEKIIWAFRMSSPDLFL